MSFLGFLLLKKIKDKLQRLFLINLRLLLVSIIAALLNPCTLILVKHILEFEHLVAHIVTNLVSLLTSILSELLVGFVLQNSLTLLICAFVLLAPLLVLLD